VRVTTDYRRIRTGTPDSSTIGRCNFRARCDWRRSCLLLADSARCLGRSCRLRSTSFLRPTRCMGWSRARRRLLVYNTKVSGLYHSTWFTSLDNRAIRGRSMRTWESKQSSVTMPGVSSSYLSLGSSHRQHCRVGRSLETPRLGPCSAAIFTRLRSIPVPINPSALMAVTINATWKRAQQGCLAYL
jgi:hypothetical protein